MSDGITTSSTTNDIDLSIFLKALHGLTMWRPIAILAISLFIGTTSLLILGRIGSTIGGVGDVLFGLLGFIIYVAFVGAGYLGAGFNLSAVVQDRDTPSISSSILFGLYSLPRLFGLIVIEALILLGLLILEMILIEVCRIPVLGGLLSLIIFPSLFVVNAALVGVALVAFNLSGPALWFGETISSALGHVVAVAKSRPGPVIFIILLLLVLYLVVFGVLTSLAVYSISFTGSMIGSALGGAVQGVMASLLGFSSFFQDSLLAGMGGSYHTSINDSLYNYAFLMVIAAFVMIVIAIPNTVLQLGLAYLYDDSTRWVDSEAGNALVGNVMKKVGSAAEAARRKAETATQQARQHAQNVAERSRAARTPTVDDSSTSASNPAFCKHCGARLEAEEKFCGECGHPTEI